jgi:uncharacterized protein (TIGR02217 family)
MSFHEIRFPSAISLGATGGPERRTEIVTLGSGREERNQRWADSRRVYNAGYGVKTIADLEAVIAFFEERRARLYGFRWKDHADFKSCDASGVISPTDQIIGTGDGTTTDFQLTKRYGSDFAPWTRTITKPVEGSVVLAVGGTVQTEGTAFTCDPATGLVHFDTAHIPAPGAVITAGFEFDVPVRFDTDRLEINLDGFRHGSIPNIAIIEIRI